MHSFLLLLFYKSNQKSLSAADLPTGRQARTEQITEAHICAHQQSSCCGTRHADAKALHVTVFSVLKHVQLTTESLRTVMYSG